MAVKYGHGRITSGFEWSSVDVIAWIPLLYSVLHTEQYVITMRATTFLQVIVHPSCKLHDTEKSDCGSSMVLVLKKPGQLGLAQVADRVSAAFVDNVPPRVKHMISAINAIFFIHISFLHRELIAIY